MSAASAAGMDINIAAAASPAIPNLKNLPVMGASPFLKGDERGEIVRAENYAYNTARKIPNPVGNKGYARILDC
tara:strand:+ start:466 stop:687 length:222 start_codon:yes stop_codon:yes gene_type:complete